MRYELAPLQHNKFMSQTSLTRKRGRRYIKKFNIMMISQYLVHFILHTMLLLKKGWARNDFYEGFFSMLCREGIFALISWLMALLRLWRHRLWLLINERNFFKAKIALKIFIFIQKRLNVICKSQIFHPTMSKIFGEEGR